MKFDKNSKKIIRAHLRMMKEHIQFERDNAKIHARGGDFFAAAESTSWADGYESAYEDAVSLLELLET